MNSKHEVCPSLYNVIQTCGNENVSCFVRNQDDSVCTYLTPQNFRLTLPQVVTFSESTLFKHTTDNNKHTIDNCIFSDRFDFGEKTQSIKTKPMKIRT